MSSTLEILLLMLLLLKTKRKAHRRRRTPRLRHSQVLLDEWRRQPNTLHRYLGCSNETFDQLVNWVRRNSRLDTTRFMTLDEKVAIFLFIVRFGATQADAQAVFKRAKSTISRVFNKILRALLPLKKEVVSQPTEATPVPSFLRNDERFWPYFEHYVGALDGTHVDAHLPAKALGEESVRLCR
jgi:hypothetical protein